ncbi:MAG TPA: hypothetical protein VME21_08225 [Steroidobacteraceae bacterium]|nr:hypothetical protein [Steroidobacteraceae bacterium]
MLQAVLTGLLVLASALYATWRLLPARRRLALLERAWPGQAAGTGWLARWHRNALADAASACGACPAGRTVKHHRPAGGAPRSPD